MRIDQSCKVLLSVIVFLTVWSFHPGWASQQVIHYNITSGELNPERPLSPSDPVTHTEAVPWTGTDVQQSQHSVSIPGGAALGSGGPTTYGDMLTPEELEQIEIMEMNSPPLPPPGIESTIVFSVPQSAVMLSEVPTSKWTFGCSATSAGMIFGYYDRTGFFDMYTGPANGGVAPLTDLGQGIEVTPISGSCSIIATQNGFDGRTVRGHVDDYWIDYGEPGPDPWEENWPEHIWEGCTADYMGTNQWKWDFNPWPDGDGIIDHNHDGSTTLFSNSNSDPLFDFVPPSNCGLPATALCHGLRLFAESRGYTAEENYTQHIDDALHPGGFSFADYMAEINAGHPVMIQVTGHSMVGVGYDEPTQTVYLHDTWDNDVHSMIWGGDYAGMHHRSVTVIHLAGGQAGTHTVILDPYNLYIYSAPTTLGEHGTLLASDFWSPDGNTVAISVIDIDGDGTDEIAYLKKGTKSATDYDLYIYSAPTTLGEMGTLLASDFWSPDGNTVAISAIDINGDGTDEIAYLKKGTKSATDYDLYIYSAPTYIGEHGTLLASDFWSPDGNTVAISAIDINGDGTDEIAYLKKGTKSATDYDLYIYSAPTYIGEHGTLLASDFWSPDGNTVAISAIDINGDGTDEIAYLKKGTKSATDYDLYIYSAPTYIGEHGTLLASDFWSPDGNTVAISAPR